MRQLHRQAIRPLLAGALLLVLALPAEAQVAADLVGSPSDGLQQPAGSASLTDGPHAATINPAGLNFQDPFSLRFLAERGVEGGRQDGPDGEGIYLGGKLFGALGWGFATEWLRDRRGIDDLRRTTWGLSLGDDALALGASVHLFSAGGTPLDDLATVDVGLLARPSRHLSIGFTVADVDRSSIAGERLPRRYVGSVGLRPFGDRLTLAIDGVLHGGDAPERERGLEGMRLGYTLLAEIWPGSTLFGALAHRVDGEGQVAAQIGYRLHFDRIGLEAAPLIQSGEGEVGAVAAIEIRSRPGPPLVLHPAARVARVDLAGALRRPTGIQLFAGRPRDPLVETVEGLRRLAGDDGIDAVWIDIEHLPDVGVGEAWQLREAIRELRAAGKRVFAHLVAADDTEYWVASAAEAIYAAPEAAFFVNGFTSRVNFYADTLQLVGIEAEAVRIGAYKNAPDTFTRSEISPTHAEVVESLLDDLFDRYVREVAASRGMEPERFREILGTGIQSARLAHELGLVDRLVYEDEIEQTLAQTLRWSVRVVATELRPEAWRSWGPPPVIAVVPIEGTIVSGRGGGDFGLVETTGADAVVDALRQAAEDPAVRAIVLRIDSGGGDAGGSQRIWRAVQEARRKKPVVASMGDAAASGGYYAAVAAERIFASPSTFTGSIGIFWLKPSIEGLLGKLRVGHYRSVRGDLADLQSIQEPWTDAERAAIERYVRHAYDAFVEAVAEGRRLDTARVEAIAQGRVWTGAQALERGLVDELGGLQAAIDWARSRAEIPADLPVEFRVYRRQEALLSADLSAGLTLRTPRLELPGWLAEALEASVPLPLLLQEEPGLWALAPFSLEIR